jgi:uncharacterized OB-fold protein|tara:strand:+ start:9074 stop:9505 length:432 start_codon:yes stop_codon:yes gene_type:complete
MSLETLVCEGCRPLPVETTKITAPFWQGLSEGVFQTTQCTECQRISFPPKAICPACHSNQYQWQTLSGKGTLYSYTIVHAAPPMFKSQTPLKVAVVDLEEGVRLVTRLIGDEAISPLDSPVQLLITQFEDGYLFAAKPIKEAR